MRSLIKIIPLCFISALIACSAEVAPELPVIDIGIPEISFNGFGDYQIGMKINDFLAKYPTPTQLRDGFRDRATSELSEILPDETYSRNMINQCPGVREFILKNLSFDGQKISMVSLAFFRDSLIQISTNDSSALRFMESHYGKGLEVPYLPKSRCNSDNSQEKSENFSDLRTNTWKHGGVIVSSQKSCVAVSEGDFSYTKLGYSFEIRNRPAYDMAKLCKDIATQPQSSPQISSEPRNH